MNRRYGQLTSPLLAALMGWLGLSSTIAAQEPAPHDHALMNMQTSSGWQFMQDGMFFAAFNHQGGQRGGDQFMAPNWWMGMASRNTTHGAFTFTSMWSLDPATVGRTGYREILQAGESLDGQPIVDRQHPHDFFMQLAAAWRIPLTSTTGLTVAGGPAGEAALGPAAFMHRPSAIDNPTAPLTHHTFDSTHVSYGVVTAALDHGRWTAEGSVFNGREPDDNRWDFDFGRLDSVSGRVWLRPSPNWEFQISTGHLKNPEALEPGNIQRSTASLAWTRVSGGDLAALTAGYGRNDTDHGARNAAFVEAGRRHGRNTAYGRIEALQTETALLESGGLSEGPAADVRDTVVALTLGGVRDVFVGSGVAGGFGADVTVYRIPDSLQSVYGSHPVSFHVFFRLSPANIAGRMWNMRMSQSMGTTMRHE